MKNALRKMLEIMPLPANAIFKLGKKLLSIKNERYFIFNADQAYEAQGPRLAVKSKFGFWYCGDIGDSADISNGILNSGLVEKEGTYLVLHLLNELEDSCTFYDVGANTGYFGILAAHVNNAKTYAFEPIKEFANTAKQSAKLNHLEDYEIFNVAVGDKKSEKEIHIDGSGTTLDSNFTTSQDLKKRTVPVIKLDDFKQGLISKPDFIKIDIEGYEFYAISGAKEVII